MLRQDPLSEHWFAFCNRGRDKIKLLHDDRNGFWLHYKRLERGRLRWPDAPAAIGRREPSWLLEGLDMGQPRVQVRAGATLANWMIQAADLSIDNNRSERAIKSFVIGRNNWMFSATPQGATASAMLYSLVITARENGLAPYAYLRHALHAHAQDPRRRAAAAAVECAHTAAAGCRTRDDR